MAQRFRIVGVVMVIVGIVGLGAGAYAWTQVQSGDAALQGFSGAQDVRLSYNGEGQLIDRGTTEGADAILALLRDDWQWPVAEGDLNPDDPLVNTGTEYMYQMATIAYHTLHGDQSVTLTAEETWDGDGEEGISATAVRYSPLTLEEGVWDPAVEGFDTDQVFAPGTYTVPVNERYWTQFNRTHPLDGPTRAQTWTGTVHGLFAELGVGATTASSLQLAQGVAIVTAVMGLGFLILGGGLLWIGMGKKEGEAAATG